MKDSYLTLATPSTGEFKDRGSKFIAYAFPLLTEDDWEERLDEVRKEHPKARHYCFAYRIGLDGNNFRANDDGEPSGTAGRPMLGQIDSFGLTNVLVVVVRYFGGTLLGASGLIQAYKTSTSEALENAETVEKILKDTLFLTFTYARLPDVMNAVKRLHLEILKEDYGENSARMEIAVRKSEVEANMLKIKSLVANISLEEAETLEEISGFSIGTLPD